MKNILILFSLILMCRITSAEPKAGEYSIEYIPFAFTYRSVLTKDSFHSKAQCKVTKTDESLEKVFERKWVKESEGTHNLRIKITNLANQRVVFVDKNFDLHGADGISIMDGKDRILIEILQAEMDKCAQQKWIKMLCLNREKPSKLLKETCSKLNNGKWPLPIVLE